ncbi:hypothetical protein SIN01_10470 [Sporolactobacillus inulinus]|nr:hypothetical protein SIN01_10470 [Sporolactobacillus inulinus]
MGTIQEMDHRSIDRLDHHNITDTAPLKIDHMIYQMTIEDVSKVN